MIRDVFTLGRGHRPITELIQLSGATANSGVDTTVSGNPISVSNALAKPASACVVSFAPIQDDGTPSPDNVLPITGWSSISVNHGADQTDYDTVTTQLGSTYYGGTVDLVTGTGTITYIQSVFSGDDSEMWFYNPTINGFLIAPTKHKSGSFQTGYADWLPTLEENSGTGIIFGMEDSTIYVRGITNTISGVTSKATWKSYLAEHPLTVVFPLSTPESFTMSPQTLQMLAGNNTVWTDASTISLTYKASL